MALSAIHLINWFYSFSLNRLSLIWFCNWKKKKKACLKNTGKPDSTCNPIDPTWTWPNPPVLPRLPKGHCWVVKVSNFAKSRVIWFWSTASLSDCSFWTSLSPSILSRMIWIASEGTAGEDEALLLLPQPLKLEGCPAAFVSVSIGAPSF